MSRPRPAGTGLLADRSGVALLEFAVSLPLMLTLSLGLLELANYILVREQISQLALQVVDNASRIGTQTTLQSVVDEKQVNDLLLGANLQAGRLDVRQNGRIVLSSLERDPDSPHGQYIHWQRCYGTLAWNSTYGPQGTGKGSDDLAGMGAAGTRVTASDTVPVMFVEIRFHYRPLMANLWVLPPDITEMAAAQVRDSRDTSGRGINPVAGVTASTCA
ncbi:MAG: pilus assembly protein [Sphingomonadales bacterium]|nr:pilus assembly protein [Sphingomonadales bacterium]